MLHNLNLNFVQFSVSKVQNCIPLSPCLPPGKSLREIRFWGFAIFVQTFSLPQIMVHLLREWSLHLSCRDVASRKMRSIFWLQFSSFVTAGDVLWWDLLSRERHDNLATPRSAENQRCTVASCWE